MKPTEELRKEHEGILLILDLLDRISEKILSGMPVLIEHFDQVIEILHILIDKCHHLKEEEILFPAIAEAGDEVIHGQICSLLSEHERSRRFAGEMKILLESHRIGGTASLTVFTSPALQYANLLRSHIWKEDSVLFPLVDQSLSEEKQKSITQEFEKLLREKVGLDKHRACHAMLTSLCRIHLGSFG